MADLDLNALRFRLADLPGFDPVGLWMELGQSPFLQRGIWTGADDAEIIDPSTGETWTVPPSWCASAADASTRDRLAQHVARRLYPGEHYIAVCVMPGRGDAAYLHALGRIYGLLTVTVSDGPRWRALLDANGDPLVKLDPHDPRVLPDGSRWVDAAALVAVAKHITLKVCT